MTHGKLGVALGLGLEGGIGLDGEPAGGGGEGSSCDHGSHGCRLWWWWQRYAVEFRVWVSEECLEVERGLLAGNVVRPELQRLTNDLWVQHWALTSWGAKLPKIQVT